MNQFIIFEYITTTLGGSVISKENFFSISLTASNVHKMKIKHLKRFLRIFHPISPSIYYVGTDFVSSTSTFCYLVFQSVKLIGRQLKGLGVQRGEGSNCSPHGTPISENSPHGSLVSEISLHISEENMNRNELIPSPKKRIRTSYNDHFKKSSFPVQHGVLFSKQQKSNMNFPNRSKMSKSEIESGSGKNVFQRPNYFVAIQISDPQIHERIREIQQHISIQDSRLNDCMNSVATLHITLMVLNVSDGETHERAKKALANVYKEYNKVMCENPLILEFSGLGHFNDKVLFAKIKENESYARLHRLADSVRKHFAKLEIFSTDQRNFNPHLTIAKIKFSNKNQKVLKKIHPSLYNELIDNHLGSANIRSIQLLRMTGPKDSMGYYTGDELCFRLPSANSTSVQIMPDISEKKKQVREKIAEATKKALKRAFNNQETSDVKNS